LINNALSGRSRFYIHLIGWMLMAMLFYYLINELRGSREALIRTGLNIACMASIFYVNANWLVNKYLERGRYRWLVSLTLLLLIGMAGFRTTMEMHLFGRGVLGLSPGWPQVFLVSLVSCFLVLCFSTLYQLVENRQELDLRHRTLEARHSQAQLDYLKARINPHFLFNTLHNIYAAAMLQHPRTADMVLRLSDLLRYVTYDAQAMQLPLQKEVEHMQAYLDLFQMKTALPLPIRLMIDGNIADRLIEPMLLLPIVENALKHGDLESNEQAYLTITLHNDSACLVLTVENTFDPNNRQKDQAGGMGLENLRQRLDLNYPQRYRLATRATGSVFFARLEIK